MSGANVTVEELLAGAACQTSAINELVLERIASHVLEIPGLAFNFDSAVLLPRLPMSAESGLEADTDALMPPMVLLKNALEFGRDNAQKRVLIFAHTDSLGDPSTSLELAELRGRCVQALLAGDKRCFADACKRSTPRDVQLILEWAARAHGYGCWPGLVDGTFSDRTRAACDRFRRRFNDDASGRLEDGADWGSGEWEAVFVLYERSIARQLGVDVPQLANFRRLTFDTPAVVSCGEHWPKLAVGPEHPSSFENRRVQIVFIEDKPHPDLTREQPPANSFYAHDLRFKKRRPETPNDTVEVRLSSTDGYPIPEIEYELHLSDGSVRRGRLDATGTAFERGVPPGPVEVEYLSADDILARALAARIRFALDEPVDWSHVIEVLRRPTASVARMEESYARYFDTLGGQGLRKDLLDASKDTEFEETMDSLLVVCGVDALAPESGGEGARWVHPLSIELEEPERG